MIAPWLHPLDFVGAMRSGAGLGLQARGQDLAEQQQAEQLALSQQELQARREQHAAQLAESLRQHNALEMYRQQEVAHQKALEAQAAAALLNTQEHQSKELALRERGENRLEAAAKAAANFAPGPPEPLTLPTGEIAGYRVQRSPHIWEQVRQPKPTDKSLTPNAELNALLRVASTGTALGKADSTLPFYSESTNALQQAIQTLDKARKAKAVPAVVSASRVRVKSPDGKVGTISQAVLADAIKAGYSEVAEPDDEDNQDEE